MKTRYWRLAATTLAGRPLAMPALILLGLILAFVLFWPAVSPYDPNEVNFDLSRQGPSPAHPLGTDQFGRDLMTRLAAGGRTTLLIVVIAVAIIAVLGISYGAISALSGRMTDAFLMRVLDGLLALPRIPIAIVILAALSLNAQNVQTVALALGVVGWMLTARLVRGQLISLRKQDYVHAAQALGARRRQVLRRHLLPNSSGVLAVALLLELPTIVIGEAFLAVLGLGPQPPTATWGNIVDEGLHFGRVWQMTLATGMIVLFALTANVIVDALGEALDPRSQVARRSPSVRRAEA
jgi:ABC-type dipeptide/oligopeptide/nickel transport system permease subunit